MITSIRPAPVRTTGCPELAESADPIRSALGTRQRPGTSRPPRTGLHAVRLMYGQWGCRAIRRGHHRGDHRQCQVRRPREESGLYRRTVARHGNPGITCQGSWRSSPAGLAARGPRRGRCDGTRQAAAPWLAQHTQPDQRSQLPTTSGWPARILLATTRPGYARLERPAFGPVQPTPPWRAPPSHSPITTRRKHT